MNEERIIQVSPQFWNLLMEYLQPSERWIDEETRGLILYTLGEDMTSIRDRAKLLKFVREKPSSEGWKANDLSKDEEG